MSTAAQIEANRKNAQLSTGPKSPETKTKCSLNAVKTGLTGRTVLLPADDTAAYQQHIARKIAEHKPATEAQQILVQSIADTEWRLLRIPTLESNIYAVGRIQFANLFEEQDPSVRPALIEAHTYLTFCRQLTNLSIQETRLRRQREKDLAALAELKKADAAERQSRLTRVAIECMRARHQGKPSPALEIGSEFSTAEIEKTMEQYKGMRDDANHPAWKYYRAA